LGIEGAAWSAEWIPKAVNLDFLNPVCFIEALFNPFSISVFYKITTNHALNNKK
jgi:hypothetical protein